MGRLLQQQGKKKINIVFAIYTSMGWGRTSCIKWCPRAKWSFFPSKYTFSMTWPCVREFLCMSNFSFRWIVVSASCATGFYIFSSQFYYYFFSTRCHSSAFIPPKSKQSMADCFQISINIRIILNIACLVTSTFSG